MDWEAGAFLETPQPQPRHRRTWLRGVGVLLIAIILVGGGFIAGWASSPSGTSSDASSQEPAAAAKKFGIFWQAWNILDQHYVDQKALNPTTMTYGAISGMLDSLGDTGHTRFLSPQDLAQEQRSLSGQLEGIGAELAMRNGQPTIVAPLPDSPALHAGVRAGDVLVKVNGKSVANESLDQIVSQVSGKAGTKVTISVIHPGQSKVTDITITRAKILVPSVTWAMLPGTTVAHVLISQFAEKTTYQLVQNIKDARDHGATAIILDLRNNPGGIFDEAIGVASQFISKGAVLIEQNAQGQRKVDDVKPGGSATSIPMVVLVNSGTASASEIVAGAIKDHNRAKIVGQTTFGTGTVLSQYSLSDGSAILVGTTEWFTPDGHQIWHKGITPDISVSLPANVIPLTPLTEQGMTAKQLQNYGDAQLLKALDLLEQKQAGK